MPSIILSKRSNYLPIAYIVRHITRRQCTTEKQWSDALSSTMTFLFLLPVTMIRLQAIIILDRGRERRQRAVGQTYTKSVVVDSIQVVYLHLHTQPSVSILANYRPSHRDYVHITSNGSSSSPYAEVLLSIRYSVHQTPTYRCSMSSSSASFVAHHQTLYGGGGGYPVYLHPVPVCARCVLYRV